MKQDGLIGEKSKTIFKEVITKAYERGTSDADITVGKLLDDIIFDLKNIISKS